jgi:hypothetical protein
MFVGSILNRTAYLPWLGEIVRVRQLKMRSVHLFLLLSQGDDAKAHGLRNERPCGEENLTSPLFLFSKRLTSGKMRGRRCCFHEAKQI